MKMIDGFVKSAEPVWIAKISVVEDVSVEQLIAKNVQQSHLWNAAFVEIKIVSSTLSYVTSAITVFVGNYIIRSAVIFAMSVTSSFVKIVDILMCVNIAV